MISNIGNIFKISDLRSRILYTLLIVLIYRIGSHIPISGVDQTALDKLFGQGGFFGFVDLFSGGSLRRFSIFALGIIPYINASIIMQLLTSVTPQLKELMDDGEVGRKRVQQYTRYLAIILAFVQAIAMSAGFKSILLPQTSFVVFMFTSVISMVAGTSLVLWMGELITERGIGNGASIIIFIGIVSMIPSYIVHTYQLVLSGVSVIQVVILVLIFLLVILAIIFIQEGQRKIPVQYTKRLVGRKVSAQNTYIPLKINQGGVIPIIFASSVLAFPATLAQFLPPLHFLSYWFSPGGIVYMLSFFLLIFFFTYFYTAITFNPVELADNIKKYGGFIVGVRPGRATAEYLDSIISRLTMVGATFLAVIAILPMVSANMTGVTSFIGLGGTALLIMVGVAIDLMKQIETHIVTRQYEGMIE